MLDINIIKIKEVAKEDFYGKFEIEPLDRGYAQTLGITLRRILLSSLQGAAITSVKINGVKHEYATIPGVEEDVLNIILNLKELKLKMFTDEPQTLFLHAKKAGPITAGDIEGNANVEILNKDLVIATLADNKNPLTVEIQVEKGTGYQNPDTGRTEISVIPVDANFSPVDRVSFEVTAARLGNITDLDKLTLEIYTKSIDPKDALYNALHIFADLMTVLQEQVLPEVEEPKKKAK